MIDRYSNPTDDNYQSWPGIIKSSMIFFFSGAIIALTLFIPGNSCVFAIYRVFFICVFFDMFKLDSLNL